MINIKKLFNREKRDFIGEDLPQLNTKRDKLKSLYSKVKESSKKAYSGTIKAKNQLDKIRGYDEDYKKAYKDELKKQRLNQARQKARDKFNKRRDFKGASTLPMFRR